MRCSSGNATGRAVFLSVCPALGLDLSDAYPLCWAPGISLRPAAEKWAALGFCHCWWWKDKSGLSKSPEEEQLPLHLLLLKKPGLGSLPQGCAQSGRPFPSEKGMERFIRRKNVYSVELWKRWKCSEKPWNTQQGAAELLLCNWMPFLNIMSQFGMGVNLEGCPLHQFKPWGRKTNITERVVKVWLVFSLANTHPFRL